ncbi:hypothetical protein, partial [Streptomyces sp. NPDC127574]|uniref:hypothetical protein n=1 Tax=Streptomyces sp. NPDC127574 TaxID=3345401 RepID=UPI003637A65F
MSTQACPDTAAPWNRASAGAISASARTALTASTAPRRPVRLRELPEAHGGRWPYVNEQRVR